MIVALQMKHSWNRSPAGPQRPKRIVRRKGAGDTKTTLTTSEASRVSVHNDRRDRGERTPDEKKVAGRSHDRKKKRDGVTMTTSLALLDAESGGVGTVGAISIEDPNVLKKWSTAYNRFNRGEMLTREAGGRVRLNDTGETFPSMADMKSRYQHYLTAKEPAFATLNGEGYVGQLLAVVDEGERPTFRKAYLDIVGEAIAAEEGLECSGTMHNCNFDSCLTLRVATATVLYEWWKGANDNEDTHCYIQPLRKLAEKVGIRQWAERRQVDQVIYVARAINEIIRITNQRLMFGDTWKRRRSVELWELVRGWSGHQELEPRREQKTLTTVPDRKVAVEKGHKRTREVEVQEDSNSWERWINKARERERQEPEECTINWEAAMGAEIARGHIPKAREEEMRNLYRVDAFSLTTGEVEAWFYEAKTVGGLRRKTFHISNADKRILKVMMGYFRQVEEIKGPNHCSIGDDRYRIVDRKGVGEGEHQIGRELETGQHGSRLHQILFMDLLLLSLLHLLCQLSLLSSLMLIILSLLADKWLLSLVQAGTNRTSRVRERCMSELADMIFMLYMILTMGWVKMFVSRGRAARVVRESEKKGETKIFNWFSSRSGGIGCYQESKVAAVQGGLYLKHVADRVYKWCVVVVAGIRRVGRTRKKQISVCTLYGEVEGELLPAISSGRNLVVEAVMDGLPVRIVLDTGAGASMVGRNFLNRIASKRKIEYVEGPAVEIVGVASDRPLNIAGTYRADIDLGGKIVRTDLVASFDMEGDAILSMDTLKRLGTLIDLSNERAAILFKKLRVGLYEKGKEEEENLVNNAVECSRMIKSDPQVKVLDLTKAGPIEDLEVEDEMCWVLNNNFLMNNLNNEIRTARGPILGKSEAAEEKRVGAVGAGGLIKQTGVAPGLAMDLHPRWCGVGAETKTSSLNADTTDGGGSDNRRYEVDLGLERTSHPERVQGSGSGAYQEGPPRESDRCHEAPTPPSGALLAQEGGAQSAQDRVEPGPQSEALLTHGGEAYQSEMQDKVVELKGSSEAESVDDEGHATKKRKVQDAKLPYEEKNLGEQHEREPGPGLGAEWVPQQATVNPYEK